MTTTARGHLEAVWRELRNDASPAKRGQAVAAARALGAVGLLSDELVELWERRFLTCPGHDDEGGRDWCAYCGNMGAR